ncbi:MAG: Ig-like domain-containing protein, partial [bacterium]
MSLSNPNFNVDVTPPLQVPAGGELTMPVVFTADDLDEFTGSLALCIDNGMEIDVRLHANTIHGGNAPNSHTAAPDTDVVYGYSEPVDPGSVSPLTFAVYGMYTGKVPGTYTVDGGRIVFTANMPFKPGEQVHATATTGVRYVSGAGPSSPHTWHFQVATTAAGSGRFVDSGQALGDNTGTSAVALGDLDGDGDLDAFVCRYGFPNLPGNQVWLNDGNGSFSDSGQSLGAARSVDVDVALGDLDGDGDLDALVSNPFPTPNEVWLNDGNGVFSRHGSLGSVSHPRVALGDLDGDGDLDALSGAVWLNDGQGAFTGNGPLPNTLAGGVLGDLDGDGDLDAYAGDAVWLNDGAAHFSKGSDVGLPAGYGAL